MKACLGDDLSTWGPLVAKAKHTLLAREEGEVVGMLAAWKLDDLKDVKEELGIADFPAVFFHISHWYLSWNTAGGDNCI